MKGKQYLIIGSDNFWYGSCFKTLKAALEEISAIKENISNYSAPDGSDQREEVPETFYIFEAKEIKVIHNEGGE